MTEWIEIGTIVAAQGLYGEMRVYPNSDFPERFLMPGQRWILAPGQTEPQGIELLGGRFLPGKGLYVIELAGVENRNQAEMLRDHKLLVSDRDRPTLEEGEFLVRDLINLEVILQETGESIGIITAVIPAGNDLLEVTLNSPTEAEAEADSISTEPPTSPQQKKRNRKPKKNKPKTILIPFVTEIVPVVNLEKGYVEITPPAGLIE